MLAELAKKIFSAHWQRQHQDNLGKAYLHHTCWKYSFPFIHIQSLLTDLPAKHLYANCPYTNFILITKLSK